MKLFPRLLLLLAVGFSLLSTPVQAKRKHHSPPASPPPLATPPPEPPSLPPETAPSISADAPPSVSLQPFVDTHLGKILAPLGESAFAQPELIASLKASYADGLAAAPAAHKPAYQLAQGVCGALAAAMTERQNAVSALRGAFATHSSEAEQPRGGAEAVQRTRDNDAFFVDSQKNTWMQRAAVLRTNITTLYLRERAVERQIGVWSPPPPADTSASASPAAAAATPSVSAPPPASADGSDPVVGQWLLANRSPLTLAGDHTITGDRHGFWRYTCTTNSGRNYEMHWGSEKNWVDYLVLSTDGRTLDGHSRKNQPISYVRR